MGRLLPLGPRFMQPWHWLVLPQQELAGAAVFAALFGREPIATLLESPPPAGASPRSRYSLCAGGPRTVAGVPQLWHWPLGSILPQLRQRLATAQPTLISPEIDRLPFTGGWLGWLGYETAQEIEQLPPPKADPLPFPIAYWYEPANFALVDHQARSIYLAATDPADLTRLAQELAEAQPLSLPTQAPTPPAVEFFSSAADYGRAVERVKAHIAVGDIYQANISLRFGAQTAAGSWLLYRRLQRINPSPFSSYWKTPWGEVVSCSPERLVDCHQGRASTRPIAGTRPRGSTPAADLALAQELLANTKEIAEHIMLVDLERNDLGKVCRWGTVAVDELLSIERYSHVMHLVSNVWGELLPSYDAIDLLGAMFPGGTITGCPKVRCMEIIQELEPYPRNLFYGSCGYLDWRGNLDLNILIRTLLYRDGQVWGQVGAGIVADSDPHREWQESLQKAQAQLQAL